MLRHFIFLVSCLALTSIACKSGDKSAQAPNVMVDTASAKATAAAAASAAAMADAHAANAAAAAASTQAYEMAETEGETANTATAATATKPTAGAKPAAVVAAKPDKPDTEGYYEHPTKKPLYPGGAAAFNKYMTDNLNYPAAARESHVEGTVYATMLVDEMGHIVDVRIASKPLGYGLEEEVIRVIKGMPQWNPGEYHNKTVKTKFTLPVVFKLK